MATTAITSHWKQLRERGLDLGPAQGSEQDAGYGGRYQVYQHGRIYWHPSTGAHELHGRLLQRYLTSGGHDVNANTGERELGFPTTGHARSEDGQYECVNFEWGTIADVSGTALVRLFGHLYKAWRDENGPLGRLGAPLDDVARIEGGRAAWFERGVLWHAEGSTDVLVGELIPPTLGQPAFVDPGHPPQFDWMRFDGAIDVVDAKPGLATALMRGRLSLKAVGGTAVLELVPAARVTSSASRRWLRFRVAGSNVGGGRRPRGREVIDSIAVSGDRRPDNATEGGPTVGGTPAPVYALQRRQLYSLMFQTRGLAPRVISPHCIYAHDSWQTFGVAHITDLHVSRRVEHYRRKLRAEGVAESAIAQLNNWNDAFRDFIRYANHLHSQGLLDVILATGDIVDYVWEVDDDQNGPGNFGFFEALVRGEAPSPDPEGSPSEPLRVPILTTLGNHDYRAHPYTLVFDVRVREEDLLGEIPLVGDLLERAISSIRGGLSALPGLGRVSDASIVGFVSPKLIGTRHEFSGLNITLSEAVRLSGLKDNDTYLAPVLTPDAAAQSLIVDRSMRQGTHYYFRRINPERSYVVQLGQHRVVMLDTRWDAGMPDGITEFVLAKVGLMGESSSNLVGGNPDSEGATDGDLALLRRSLAAAKGIVLVGMHAPPLNPKGNELPNFFREMAHPAADPIQVTAYLRRVQASLVVVPDPSGRLISPPRPDAFSTAPGWPRSGTPYFHRGPIGDLLDFGTAIGHKEAIAQVIARSGRARNVLVVTGHGHRRVDYRLRWDDRSRALEAYTDFYLENPPAYYPMRLADTEWWNADKDRRLLMQVQDGAPVSGTEKRLTDNRAEATWPNLDALVVPPYATPLSTATDVAAWWETHGPIVIQSAALGPCTNTRPDRDINEHAPGPNFQGFRLIQIEADRIAKVRYITTPELRGSFPLPWERGRTGVIPEVVIPVDVAPVTPPPVGGGRIRETVTADGRVVRDHRDR